MADTNSTPEATGGVHVLDEGDGIDYSEYFKIRLPFNSVEEAFNYANDIAMGLGFFLVKANNHKGADKRVRNIVKCDRYGVFKSKADPNTPSPRLNRSTKKCNCPFAIKIVEGKNLGRFAVTPKKDCGFHNHGFLTYLDGHRRKARLSQEVKQFVLEQTRALVPPRNIKLSLVEKLKNERVPGSSGDEICVPDIKTIYNIRSRYYTESRGERNSGQQMLHLARENNYIFFTKVDESSSLTHIFMCHPEAARMYRAYPYVVVMDSTYKTNQYQIPVVEMIGVSPVGKNFLIAYALVENETTESYEWVLNCLKRLLPEGLHPTTIVTDRELGLMNALEGVFRDANHLLCTFHIYGAVEAYALNAFKRNAVAAQSCARGMFGRMLKALTEDDFDKAWEEFREAYAHWPGLVGYIRGTWMLYKRKWARCYTNKMLHFQNTATSRVEAAHAVLKTWIGSSTVACDSLWRRAHEMMEHQQSTLRKKLSDSLGKSLVDLAGVHARLFAHMSGKVSHLAIQIMRDEYEKGEELGLGLDNDCGCSLQKTHGLPCACQLHFLNVIGQRVELDLVHVFWRTLVYGDHPVAEFDRVVQLNDMFDEIRQTDPSTWTGIMSTVYRHLHPEHEDVQPPRVAQRRKGRPKNSTTRNRSHVEHERRRAQPIPPAPMVIVKDYEHVPQSPLERGYTTTEDRSNLPFRSLVPAWFRPYYEAFFDPAGDGHCGFRCMSHATIGEDSGWMAMRRAVSEEMMMRPFYRFVYGDEYDAAICRITWTDGSRSCGQAHWMYGVDLYGFATLHSWIVCVVSSQGSGQARNWHGSCTYLPVYAPHGVDRPLGELWLLHSGSHWRRIRVSEGAPMPPLNPLWNLDNAHHESVHLWPDYYNARLATWAVHEGH